MSEDRENTVEVLTWLDTANLHQVFEHLRRINRPGDGQNARRILILALGYLDAETGQVKLTRDQISALLGMTGDRVSTAITALCSLGVMKRERTAVCASRGVPAARYSMNPHLAWSGSFEARQRWLPAWDRPRVGAYLRRRDHA